MDSKPANPQSNPTPDMPAAAQPAPSSTAQTATALTELQWLANRISDTPMSFADHSRAQNVLKFVANDFANRLQH